MRRHRLLPFCALLGVLFAGFLPKLDAQEVLVVGKRDIIFLIDSTMRATLINSVREFIKRFVDRMPIGPDNVQVGVATFGNIPRLVMDLNSHGYREAVTAALLAIKPRPGQSVNIGAALEFVRNRMIVPEKGSRYQQGIPQLLLLLTSKKSSDSVEAPARELQRMGVLTLAAGSKAADEQELKQIAFNDSIVFMLRDFRGLLRPPIPDPIIGALSTLAGVVVTEVPTEPVVEITTVQTQRVVRDIVFLVDGSNYIGNTNWPYVRDFMINVVNQLDVRPERVRIGLVQFAADPRIEFYLNSYSNRADVVNKISQLRLTGGTVLNTGAAMNHALAKMFSGSAGSRKRQGVQQVLVLITGGPSQDEVKSVADKAAVERVLIFTVSSGQADETLLRSVDFVPDLAYHERSFSTLPAMAEVIMPKLITVVGDTDITYTEETEEPVTVPGMERDVAFLIDGSDNVRADFAYVRDFIIKVIEPLDIAQDRVRISVVQHSERPTASFYLNTYQTKEDVMTAVNTMAPTGGRSLNTGAALRFMKDTIMSEAYGSRAKQNVPQFLIVLTAGRSRDNVKEPAGELKTEGIVPFGVGVKDADPRQIQDISHNPSFAFTVKEFSELSTLPQKLNNYVSLPREELTLVLQQDQSDAVKRDFVFLLDGSDNTRDGFPDIKLFVKSIVESISVSEGKDRVSVVQFADNPEVSFYLNSHKTKTDIQNAIENVRHRGGRRLNIGQALQFVRHSVFTSSRGSRRLEGVPQMLILLSSKPSTDSVRGPAFALKEHEIVSVGVGVGDASLSELETIAFKPGFTYKVTGFSKLPSIQSQLLATLNINKGTQETETGISDLVAQESADLVILIDGSQNVGAANFPFVRDLVLRIIERLDVGRDTVRVALALYNSSPEIKFYLNSYESKSSVLEAVKGLAYSGGDESNLGAALEEVAESLLGESAGGRADEGVPQMLLVISAGPASDDTGAGDRALKRAGVITFGVTIGDTATADLEVVATDKSFVLLAPDFRAVANMFDQLLPYINGVVERTIIVHTEFTEVLVVGKRDIIFLIDSTMGATLINSVREFIKRFVDRMPIGPDDVQVGVATFGINPRLEMDLNSHGSREAVTAALPSIKPRPGQSVNIGAALEFVRTRMIVPEKGSRYQQGIPQLLLLLTTKKSSDSVEAPARELQRMGVLTLAAGSKAADEQELRQIAFNDSIVFMLRDFHGLLHPAIPDPIIAALSTLAGVVVTEVPTEPVVEITTVQTQRVVRDIVFLVDGSDYIGNTNWPYVRDFMINVVNQLDVRPERVRIGLVQFAADPRIEFYLNSYSNRADVVNKISQLRLTGGSVLNTGAAMNHALAKMFSASAGSRKRQGVQQVLVLITGGPSQDEVKSVADKAALERVLTFTVSSGQADETLLRSVAFVPDLAYHDRSFSTLPAMAEVIMPKLIPVVCATDITYIPEETEEPVSLNLGKKDIIFLIDGSDNTGPEGIAHIRDFILNIVRKLDVQPDQVRVSVVQYADKVKPEFSLNSHNDKPAVISAIQRLRQMGGRSSDLADAIKYVMQNELKPSAGVRLSEASQHLVVLTGGRSSQDVSMYGHLLKSIRVNCIGVGASGADTRQLGQIATSSEDVLQVPTFPGLSAIRERFITRLSGTMPVEPPPYVYDPDLPAAKKAE